MPIETWESADARVRVRTGGEGARRLLIAVDPPNLVEHYAQLAVALRPHARFAVYEPPPFGHSRGPRRAVTFEGQADVVIGLAERLGAPVVVVAPCVNAYAALHAAHRRPDLIEGLVLLQAPSLAQERAWLERVDRKRVMRTPLVGQIVAYARAERIADQWYGAALADPAHKRRYLDLATEGIAHGARFPLAAAFQALARAGDVPRVDAPVLHVWGAQDRTHKKSAPESVREHAPRAEIVRVEGAAHFPELEQPRAFVDAMLAWMDRNGLQQG